MRQTLISDTKTFVPPLILPILFGSGAIPPLPTNNGPLPSSLNARQKFKYSPFSLTRISDAPVWSPAHNLEDCYRLGVNAYAVEPVRFSEFVETVKQIGVFWPLLNDPSPSSVKMQ